MEVSSPLGGLRSSSRRRRDHFIGAGAWSYADGCLLHRRMVDRDGLCRAGALADRGLPPTDAGHGGKAHWQCSYRLRVRSIGLLVGALAAECAPAANRPDRGTNLPLLSPWRCFGGGRASTVLDRGIVGCAILADRAAGNLLRRRGWSCLYSTAMKRWTAAEISVGSKSSSYHHALAGAAPAGSEPGRWRQGFL